MFWHGTIGIIIAMSAVLIEAAAEGKDGSGIRLFHYDKDVYLLMLGATLFDSLTVNSVTIAYQSDSSGFVALISYVGILYAFASDQIIFHESFTILELLAAIVILVVTVCMSVYKIREGKRAKLRRADSFTSAEDVNRSIVNYD